MIARFSVRLSASAPQINGWPATSIFHQDGVPLETRVRVSPAEEPMQKQSGDEYKKLEKAFTAADNAFRNDFSVIYGTEQRKAQLHFDHMKRMWKSWENPGQCLYRGCSKSSIRRSHSIQKSAHLEYLAEAQHILTPRLDNRGQLAMKRVGVNLASTFPGFCEEHEQIFSEFEALGGVSSARHVGLQAFRTLCREIFRKRNEIADMESTIAQYRQARTDFYVDAVKTAIPDATFGGMEIKGDGMERFVVSRLQVAKRVLADLDSDLFDELFEFVSNEQSEPCLKVVSLPYEVPVACSGFGNLVYEIRGKRKEAFCPLGILPQPGATIAYIATPWKHSAVSDDYFARMAVGFGALNAMESWIVNGSDHWFIRPSAWDSIPATRQKKILDQIARDDDNIGSFLSFSIFDDARRKIIAWINEGLDQVDTKTRRKVLKMIEKESAKLTD
jgi:hypothetical protein